MIQWTSMNIFVHRQNLEHYRRLLTEPDVISSDCAAPYSSKIFDARRFTDGIAAQKCGKPKKFMLAKSGGRKFRCIDCDITDPLKTPEMQNLLSSELKPPV
jgi:hypothetical protein